MSYQLSQPPGYVLSRHVPSIRDRGLTLSTDYGELVVEPGPLADRIAKLIESHCRFRSAESLSSVEL